MRPLNRSETARKLSPLSFSTRPFVNIELVIFDVGGLVDQEPLLQVDILVDLSVEPQLRYHAKVPDHVELAVVVDRLHYRRSDTAFVDPLRAAVCLDGVR